MVGGARWRRYSLAAGAAITLALFGLAWAFPTFPGDEPALLGLQSLQRGWLSAGALAVSRLGWAPLSVPLVLAAALALLLLRRRADALVMTLSLAPMAVGNALKTLVHRPRPDHILYGPAPESLSFPSGHSIYAVLFCGLLIFLAEQLIGPPAIRRGVQAALALLILAVGASRVYLGAHWPSDVVGGYLFGALALPGLIWLRNRLVNRLG